MGEMGYGYGSECHVLRWMGRHRRRFNEHVSTKVGRPNELLEWLDFRFQLGRLWPDAELRGMEFLEDRPEFINLWEQFWPQGAGIQTWDAVGWSGTGTERELILVEAKARIGEDMSDCKATHPDSVQQIAQAFRQTKDYLGVDETRDWMRRYYQVTNRIAALYFLQVRCHVPARLLFLYFYGDLRGAGRNSPQTEELWSQALLAQNQHVGLPENHRLRDRIHTLFLPIVE
jgi:hypothetical protein